MTRTGPMIIGFLLAVLAGPWGCGPALAAADAAAPIPSAEAVVWSAPDQEAAKKRATEVMPFVEAVRDECRLCRQQRLRDQGLGVKDQSESYFLLDSPIIRKTEDHYGPVRFMHSKHAVAVKDVLAGLIPIDGLKDRIGGFVDDGDLVLGHAQVLNGVALGAFGDSDDMVGPTHSLIDMAVVACALLGQKVRIEQECQVMNGDDRSTAWAMRRNKVGTVKHVQTQAHQLDVQRIAFQPVMAGRPERDTSEVGLL